MRSGLVQNFCRLIYVLFHLEIVTSPPGPLHVVVMLKVLTKRHEVPTQLILQVAAQRTAGLSFRDCDVLGLQTPRVSRPDRHVALRGQSADYFLPATRPLCQAASSRRSSC